MFLEDVEWAFKEIEINKDSHLDVSGGRENADALQDQQDIEDTRTMETNNTETTSNSADIWVETHGHADVTKEAKDLALLNIIAIETVNNVNDTASNSADILGETRSHADVTNEAKDRGTFARDFLYV